MKNLNNSLDSEKDPKEKKYLWRLRKAGAVLDILGISGGFLGVLLLAAEPITGGLIALGSVAISKLLKRGVQTRETKLADTLTVKFEERVFKELAEIRSSIEFIQILVLVLILGYVGGIFIKVLQYKMVFAFLVIVLLTLVFWPKPQRAGASQKENDKNGITNG